MVVNALLVALLFTYDPRCAWFAVTMECFLLLLVDFGPLSIYVYISAVIGTFGPPPTVWAILYLAQIQIRDVLITAPVSMLEILLRAVALNVLIFLLGRLHPHVVLFRAFASILAQGLHYNLEEYPIVQFAVFELYVASIVYMKRKFP